MFRISVVAPVCLSLVVLGMQSSVEARTWRIVPGGGGDAPTIQVGLDSAVAGDEVLLAAGRFTWTSEGPSGASMIRMKAGVTLRGEMGAAATTLDAEGHGRVIDCVDIGAARIEGLTVTGGVVDPISDHESLSEGAGIRSKGAAALVISQCVVRGNGFEHADQAFGGGIYCVGGEIADCTIEENEAAAIGGHGGGIYCIGTAVRRCVVQRNRVRGEDGAAIGGGIVALEGARLEDCRIEANVNRGSASDPSGGGVELADGLILRCVVVDNRITGANARGGGVHCVGSTIVGSVFAANFVSGYGLFTSDLWGGAAIAGFGFGAPNTIRECTVVGNTAVQSFPSGIAPVAGIALSAGGTISHCIVWGNDGAACFGNLTFRCTDIANNSGVDTSCTMDSGDVFAADPQFCAVDPAQSGNFELQQDSPCAPGNRPPMNCGQIGARPVGCESVAVVSRAWSAVKSLYR